MKSVAFSNILNADEINAHHPGMRAAPLGLPSEPPPSCLGNSDQDQAPPNLLSAPQSPADR